MSSKNLKKSAGKNIKKIIKIVEKKKWWKKKSGVKKSWGKKSKKF